MKTLMIFFILMSCSSLNYKKTVPYVEIKKFMKKWYVIAGRTTFLEDGAHNSTETYSWNEEEKRIDIEFKFNKDSFTGKETIISQRAWIYNKKTQSHWKVSPFWPLKLDFLIIALANDYSWAVVGVPNGKYVWIMSESNFMGDEVLKEILARLEKSGYPIDNIKKVPHQIE